MKPFREQFLDCRSQNLNTEKGEFLSFKDHPELMPLFPSREMIEAVKDGTFSGLQTLKCGMFNNGSCSGGNKECKKLRGLEN